MLTLEGVTILSQPNLWSLELKDSMKYERYHNIVGIEIRLIIKLKLSYISGIDVRGIHSSSFGQNLSGLVH